MAVDRNAKSRSKRATSDTAPSPSGYPAVRCLTTRKVFACLWKASSVFICSSPRQVPSSTMSTTKRETRPLWVQANPRNARTSRLESYRVDRQTETEPTPIGLSISRGTHRMTDSHDKTAVSVCATNERFHIAGPDNLVPRCPSDPAGQGLSLDLGRKTPGFRTQGTWRRLRMTCEPASLSTNRRQNERGDLPPERPTSSSRRTQATTL